MRKITTYLFRHLSVAMIFVTMTLTFAVWLMQSLRLIDMIVNKGLPLSLFLYMSSLLLPTLLSLILPIALFAALMFVYNRLTMDSELVVMQASGVSSFGLAKPALVMAGLITVIGYSLSLYLLPTAYREFKELQFIIRNDYSSVLLQEGVFTTLSDEVTVFVRERNSDGNLAGIFVHDNRIADRPVTMMAESGTLLRTDNGPRVIMINGNRQEVSKTTGQLSLLYFDNYSLDVRAVDKGAGKRWHEARERYLHELFAPDMNDSDDVKNIQKLRSEGHQRIVMPLYALVFTLIGLAALLGGSFNRRGQTKRIAAAISLVVLFQASAIGFANLAARFNWAEPLLYVNILIPVFGSIFVLSSKHLRKKKMPPLPPAVTAAGSI
ncbi:MAG: LPS export ABC transporter permease LptF [Rhodospirillaceae bacterium]|nr:LPS export ABC transporter permease LptF [Rhodospirillaceae bacterium]MBT5659697.1 LPS export ABC transporter permease LptF [Rhodospirillaceae bacterium]